MSTAIPQGWQECRLESCIEVLDSLRVPVNNVERQSRIEGKPAEQLYPYYGATGKVGVIDDFLFDEELVALGEDGVPFLDPFKQKAYMLRGKTWVNNHAHVLRGLDGVALNKFIFYYLNQFNYQGYVNGGTRLKLTQANMRKIPIALPSLAEQIRIAAKLDELLAQVDTLKARIGSIPALLKRFRQSVLAVAVSGHLTEKWRSSLDTSKPLASWKNCKIGDISSLVTSGSRGWADYYSDSGAIFIRSQDINTDELEISDTAFVKLPGSSEGKRTRVQYQDILLTITGANVGKVARVKQQIPEAYVSQHVALVRLYKPEYAPFIELFLKDIGSGRGFLLDLAYGGGKPGLNLSNIRDLLLPLPPIDEQIEIIRRVEQLFAFADQLEAKVTKAQSRIDLLTQSILAKAFRGKLVPQDLNDEPASVLLERIKVKRTVPPKAKRRSKSF
ncbi:restriction endonuclease subunit S [Pseudomonas viridiflava]|uniref:restriction endonuclease subunit S n=1 Tax=Pseudomonas viridiflava TaxID=33069 RepID=UPI001303A84F|nr:restriction endonuclease subunit S [Pseudomonas viridiflava]